MPQREAKPTPGDLFEIPLEDGRLGYGQVLSATLYGFFAIASEERAPVEKVLCSPAAFRIGCLTGDLEEGLWPVLGNFPLAPAMREPLKLFRSTAPDFWFIYEWRPETGGHDRWVAREEAAGLERAGLWEPRSAAKRLAMYLRGEPCPWVETA